MTLTLSKSNRRKKKFGYSKLVTLIFSASIFGLLIKEQNAAISPEVVRSNLIESGNLITLEKWQAKFFQCDSVDRSICAQVGSINDLKFPAKDQLTTAVKAMSKRPTKVQLTYNLTARDWSWLEGRPTTVILIPRMVHRYSYMINYPSRQLRVGMGANVSFPVRSQLIRQEKKIQIEIEFGGYEWFGPADLPIALSEPNTVAKYESIPGLAISSSHLTKQLDVALPLVLTGMAVILDHSRSFQALSIFAVARAARSYLAFKSELYSDWLPDQVVDLLFILVNALMIPLMMFFLSEVTSVSLSRSALNYIGIVSFIGFYLASRYVPTFRFRIDLWSDSIACIIAIPLSLKGMRAQLNHALTKPRNKSERRNAKQSEISLILFRTGLIFLGVLSTGWANIADVVNISDSSFKEHLQWGHTSLIPIFIIVALFEIGSITRKMKGFARTMVEKAILERDIDVGKEIQSLLLPAKQGKGDYWEWRSFYYPSSTLAGDWFDVRKIKTSDDNDYIVCCVVDVTGHGVGAALISTAISSHWSIWCRNQEGKPGPKTDEERETLAKSAPKSIHDGLTALRQNTGCTAAFIILDERNNRASYCTAGHPGILRVAADKKVDYLSTLGTRPGFSDSEIGWNSKSITTAKDDLLFIYSDGVVPHDQQFSGWIKRLCRPRQETTTPLSLIILNGIRENKTAFRKNRKKEDDMSLLILKRSA